LSSTIDRGPELLQRIKVTPNASAAVVDSETGETHGSFDAVSSAVTVMPGVYDLRFTKTDWRFIKVDGGSTVTLKPVQVVLPRDLKWQKARVTTKEGKEAATFDAVTYKVALPPGDYVVEVDGRKIPFPATEGEVLEVKGPSSLFREFLFADLPAERRLHPPEILPDPPNVVARANVALAQGLIRLASGVTLELSAGARAGVRQVHLRRLLCTVRRAQPATVRIDISGAFSLFRQTLIYGRALASILPLVAWCEGFDLTARCVLRDRTVRIKLGRAIRYRWASRRGATTAASRSGLRANSRRRHSAGIWSASRSPSRSATPSSSPTSPSCTGAIPRGDSCSRSSGSGHLPTCTRSSSACARPARGPGAVHRSCPELRKRRPPRPGSRGLVREAYRPTRGARAGRGRGTAGRTGR
jgi:hypothetical protein